MSHFFTKPTLSTISRAAVIALATFSASVLAQSNFSSLGNELLDESAAALERNLLDRCNRVPADARENCLTQMRGQANTEVYGSVQGGGILRQTTIVIPGETYTPDPVSKTIVTTPDTFQPELFHTK